MLSPCSTRDATSWSSNLRSFIILVLITKNSVIKQVELKDTVTAIRLSELSENPN